VREQGVDARRATEEGRHTERGHAGNAHRVDRRALGQQRFERVDGVDLGRVVEGGEAVGIDSGERVGRERGGVERAVAYPTHRLREAREPRRRGHRDQLHAPRLGERERALRRDPELGIDRAPPEDGRKLRVFEGEDGVLLGRAHTVDVLRDDLDVQSVGRQRRAAAPLGSIEVVVDQHDLGAPKRAPERVQTVGEVWGYDQPFRGQMDDVRVSSGREVRSELSRWRPPALLGRRDARQRAAPRGDQGHGVVDVLRVRVVEALQVLGEPEHARTLSQAPHARGNGLCASEIRRGRGEGSEKTPKDFGEGARCSSTNPATCASAVRCGRHRET